MYFSSATFRFLGWVVQTAEGKIQPRAEFFQVTIVEKRGQRGLEVCGHSNYRS